MEAAGIPVLAISADSASATTRFDRPWRATADLESLAEPPIRRRRGAPDRGGGVGFTLELEDGTSACAASG